MNWKKILIILESFLIFLGLIFLAILVHELTHMVDGYSENIAVCFGFINWERQAFVINGDNYTLFRGEPLAFGIDIVVFGIIGFIYYKARKRLE